MDEALKRSGGTTMAGYIPALSNERKAVRQR
jgi:hypothetical protein